MITGVYVSSDELEQAVALVRGYRQVCQHPGEVGILERDELLVIDLDHILFDDIDQAVAKVVEAAQMGARVGIHTYRPHHPSLASVRAKPNVVVRKTHRRVLAAICRLGPPRGGAVLVPVTTPTDSAGGEPEPKENES